MQLLGPRFWGHITIKMAGHPPFGAQIILNGHEYVACQSRKARLPFTKENNCVTHITNPARLAKIADTLADDRAIGRLSPGVRTVDLLDVFVFRTWTSRNRSGLASITATRSIKSNSAVTSCSG